MYIHAKLTDSRVNGPGNRAVIWLQGCTLRCPGCQNPKTHVPREGFHQTPVQLRDWILSLDRLDGVTFSGGEPLQQLEDGLYDLVHILHMRRPKLSIGLFTGYTEQELESGNYRATFRKSVIFSTLQKKFGWYALKHHLDFAVMGRYNEQQRIVAPMRSSTNQKLVLFSNRYTEEDFPPLSQEVHISEDGNLVKITGF